VQASAFVGSDDDFSAGHALGLGDFGEDGLAVLDGSSAYLKNNLPEAVSETRPPERSRRRAPTSSSSARIWEETAAECETLLRRAREAGEARYFEEDFQLIEVHGVLG